MKHSIGDIAEAVVLVIEPAASVRMMIMEVLKSLGFQHLHGVAHGKDALSIMEVERIHWLVTPMLAAEPVNALQILKLITVEPELQDTVVTLMLDPLVDDSCLPLAFELGLLSYQTRAYVKDTLHNDFQELVRLIASHQSNLTLTAADYLRRFLSEKNMHASRVALEQNLLSVYPGSPKILFHMAEAEIQVGNYGRALDLLFQAEIIDENLVPLCKHLRAKVPKSVEAEAHATRENTLGIKKVVIIDPDSGVIFATTSLLNHVGITNIAPFDNGLSAFEWMSVKGQEPDLIIMEWRIPGLAGPVLIQRIRHSGLVDVPIILISSLIKREEKPLLVEMGIDDIIEKPFDKTAFFTVVIGAIQQHKMPTEAKSLVRKIRALVSSGKLEEAEILLGRLLKDSRAGEGTKKGLQAEFALARNEFKSACDLGVEALRIGGETLLLLNLVGKALLKLNEYEKALKCFERANSLCSINLERILTIAEIYIELDRKEAALKAISEASALDPDNILVQEAKCKVDLECGKLPAAVKTMDELESVPRIASYINNRGIALARSGRYEDGISLYKKAILCLDENWGELAVAVSYNLGLAYVRQGDFEPALKILEVILLRPKTPIHRKALALLQKVERSIKSGEKILLVKDDLHEPDAAEKPVEGKRQLGKLGAKRGDIGCHLIFMNIEGNSEKALAMIAIVPHYLKRKSIGSVIADLRQTGS